MKKEKIIEVCNGCGEQDCDSCPCGTHKKKILVNNEDNKIKNDKKLLEG